MLLSEPPVNPHIEAALKASNERRERDFQAALAIEPVISPTTEKLLLASMAWETGAIIPSTQAWKVEDRRKQAEAESESTAEATGQAEVAVGEIRAAAARRASMGKISDSTVGEWWSTASSDFGDATVSGARGGSAPVGPIAWWPKTTVFKRRDSLVQLINDKSISAEERKARRLMRSREKEKNEVPRGPTLHVKHYGKMCLQRSDQKLSFRDSETFPVVDTYHHPLRDRSLSELRERAPGLRPENMDHNATLIIRERGISTANPEEARRTPKHPALYYHMAALPDLPTEARPATVPTTMDQPSLSLAYMRERTSLASRGASEHDLRLRDNLRKLDEKMESAAQQKHTVAARHSFQDVERHVRRPATEPTGTTADGRPVSSGPGYAIGSDRMPVHTGVVPQRWTVGRGKDQRLMDPSMWDEARELAETSRGSDRSAIRQTSWKRLDTPTAEQQRQWKIPGAELSDLSAIGIDADASATAVVQSAAEPESEAEQTSRLERGTAERQPQVEPNAGSASQSQPEIAKLVAASEEPKLDIAPHLQSAQESVVEAASRRSEADQPSAGETTSAATIEESGKLQPQLATESAESDFSIAALEAEFSGSITPRASTPGSVGQWEETRTITAAPDSSSRRHSGAGGRPSLPATRPPDPNHAPHVGGLAGSRAPAAGARVSKVARPAQSRAATLDPRSNRAVSAAAIAARREGVWAISKRLREERSDVHNGGLGQPPSRQSSSRLSSRSAEFQKGSRWSTLVADELSAPDVGELPLALPGSFQGDPAARWFGSNRVLRSSRSRENMASLSAVSSFL